MVILTSKIQFETVGYEFKINSKVCSPEGNSGTCNYGLLFGFSRKLFEILGKRFSQAASIDKYGNFEILKNSVRNRGICIQKELESPFSKT